MRVKSTWILAVFAALAAALLVLAGTQTAWAAESVTIEGDIEEAEYDPETDDVISVSIWDAELGSVLIANSGKGRELLGHVGDEVRVTGIINEFDEESGFDYVMDVTSYEVISQVESEEEPEDEPDWSEEEG